MDVQISDKLGPDDDDGNDEDKRDADLPGREDAHHNLPPTPEDPDPQADTPSDAGDYMLE